MKKSIDTMKREIKDKMLQNFISNMKRFSYPNRTRSNSACKMQTKNIRNTNSIQKSQGTSFTKNVQKKVTAKRHCNECLNMLSKGLSSVHCPHHY